MVRRAMCVLFAVIVVGAFGAGSALAVAPGPLLEIHSLAVPTSFTMADSARCEAEERACDAYRVTVTNVGDAPTDGSAFTIRDALPPGLVVQGIALYQSGERVFGSPCDTVAVQCNLPTVLHPDESLEMFVHVTVRASAPGELNNAVNVSGGGAPEASTSVQNPTGAQVPFGFSAFETLLSGLDGMLDTRAAGHPYEYRVQVDLNSAMLHGRANGAIVLGTSVEDVKDVMVDLPVGLVGSVLATPTCTFARLSTLASCPASTVVGHLRTEPAGATAVNSPIYNLVPEKGVAAEFGYLDSLRAPHVLYSSVVPSTDGYVLRTIAPDAPQVDLTDIETVFYGNPAAHDGNSTTPAAFLTIPSSCSSEPLLTQVHSDSWQKPGRYHADGTPDFTDPSWAAHTAQSPSITGCEALRFEPSLALQPETTIGDTPTGMNVNVQFPQHQNPETLGTPPLRNATLTLPAGLSINPAAAAGLSACSEAQIALASASPPSCPDSSKIATLEAESPAVAGVLQGSVYLATQDANPFHALFAGYLVVDDPTTGVVVKIPGQLKLDSGSGQITGVFNEDPQLPVSALRLHFFGGARGELATPSGCGTYTTLSDLMPWSAPQSGPDATPSSSFGIDSGCANPFAPGFTAGSQNPVAGGYAPFALSISRQDGEQTLSGVSVTLPEGSLGKLAGIPPCPEANANAGTCPDASRVGSATAGAGAGPDPYFVSGDAYLTGPYKGGPFGLVEEVPAVAGPFNLGMVVVRQSLRIDPHTAQATAVSDPLPTILDGIPLQVRRVDVTLDRPGFMFNPTSCTPMQVTGTLTSAQGATANVSSRFQVGGCGELSFKPSFKASTQHSTSKKNGASLDVKVGSSQGQANIAKAAVTLPKQLPARLTTIQQACTEAAFAQNPASCPAGSNIGTAVANTPVLANPLVGPAYLVSHGGAAFPDVDVVLQGEGLTLDLTGSVNIRHGITSSAFNGVPDAPISTFELSLPEGPHSGLAAVVPAKTKGNLCGTALTMPTTLTGQNGAVVKQNTKIAVTGCGKAKSKKKPKKRKGRKK